MCVCVCCVSLSCVKIACTAIMLPRLIYSYTSAYDIWVEKNVIILNSPVQFIHMQYVVHIRINVSSWILFANNVLAVLEVDSAIQPTRKHSINYDQMPLDFQAKTVNQPKNAIWVVRRYSFKFVMLTFRSTFLNACTLVLISNVQRRICSVSFYLLKIACLHFVFISVSTKNFKYV